MDKLVKINVVVNEKALPEMMERLQKALTDPSILALTVKAEGDVTTMEKFKPGDTIKVTISPKPLPFSECTIHNPGTCNWLPMIT
ncbi:MAG: hypothetical protein HGA78_02650 [Nitrospirales bacterium]|nr:hypothetical protein [Nitrospirales bacterium]